jgi:hypothetical protein
MFEDEVGALSNRYLGEQDGLVAEVAERCLDAPVLRDGLVEAVAPLGIGDEDIWLGRRQEDAG